jgi:hypothetical protein
VSINASYRNDPMFVYNTLSLFFLVTVELTPSHRTREQLKSFQLLVAADYFPRFLWERERVDPSNMNKGFLRGQLLIKICAFSLPNLRGLLDPCR